MLSCNPERQTHFPRETQKSPRMGQFKANEVMLELKCIVDKSYPFLLLTLSCFVKSLTMFSITNLYASSDVILRCLII